MDTGKRRRRRRIVGQSSITGLRARLAFKKENVYYSPSPQPYSWEGEGELKWKVDAEGAALHITSHEH